MRPFAIAALLAAALAGVPAAHADSPLFDCNFHTIAQATLTGGENTFVGIAYGYVASTGVEPVSIRCYVLVDGTEAASTPVGTGTSVATAHGMITFTATESQDVKFCAERTAGTASGTRCEGPTET